MFNNRLNDLTQLTVEKSTIYIDDAFSALSQVHQGVLALVRVDKKDANYTIVAKRGECKPNQKIFVKKYVQQHYRSDA